MIFPDVNILIYAYNSASQEHEKASAWLASVLNGHEKVCFSWHTILGFVRISTTPSMFPHFFSSREAMSIAGELIDAPNSTMIAPGTNHFAIFRKLVSEAGIGGPMISDAHLAALAIEHGATVATSDKDFRLFEDLKFFNPLQGN